MNVTQIFETSEIENNITSYENFDLRTIKKLLKVIQVSYDEHLTVITKLNNQVEQEEKNLFLCMKRKEKLLHTLRNLRGSKCVIQK